MAVQKTRVYNSPAYTWDNGDLFNGYVLLVMSFPSGSGVPYEYATLNDTPQRLRVPRAYKFPIKNGFIVEDSYAWTNFGANISINPPECNYSPLYYDHADRLVAIPNHNQGFGGTEININAGDTLLAPTPNFNLTGQGQSSFGGVPTVETPYGVIDGVNKIFTLSKIPNGLFLFRDGFGPLATPTDYTLSGATLTMVTAPVVAAQFKAYIF